MKIRKTPLAAIGLIALMSSGLAVAKAASNDYALFGDAALVSPGNNSPTAAEISSDADAPGYGGVDFTVPTGLTFADLETLGADYMFTAGSCGGGSPRFQVNVVDPDTGDEGNIFVYLGAAPNYTGCPQNVWLSTGDLLETGQLIDTSQVGGTFYQEYSAAVAAFGDYEVVGVQLVVDASWAFPATGQTVRVDNVTVDDATVTFESGDSCKKGGWQAFTAAPGPFKNQGQCVSYFAKGGQ